MADFRVGEYKIGFSVRAFMAVVFSITTCYMSATGKIGAEVFVPLAAIIVNSYFSKKQNEGEQNA